MEDLFLLFTIQRKNLQKMNFSYFLLSLILSYFSYWIFLKIKKFLRIYQLASTMNGPKAYPIIGNILNIYETKSVGAYESKASNLLRARIGVADIVRLWIFHKLFVIVKDPVHAQEILKNIKVRKNNYYKHVFEKTALGQGILTQVDQDLWKRQRKNITPTFHFQILHTYIQYFYEESISLCETISKEIKVNENVELDMKLKLAGFDMIVRNVLGVHINAQKNPEHPFLLNIIKTMQLIQRRIYQPWLLNDFLFRIFGYYKEQVKATHEINNFMKNIIQLKRKQQEEEIKNKHDDIKNNNTINEDYKEYHFNNEILNNNQTSNSKLIKKNTNNNLNINKYNKTNSNKDHETIYENNIENIYINFNNNNELCKNTNKLNNNMKMYLNNNNIDDVDKNINNKIIKDNLTPFIETNEILNSNNEEILNDNIMLNNNNKPYINNINISHVDKSFNKEFIKDNHINEDFSTDNTPEKISNQSDDIQYGFTKHKSFLELLLEIGHSDSPNDKLTDAEILPELTTIFFAALDTTSTTNSVILLLLAMHPEVMNKVLEEIDSIFGGPEIDNGRIPSPTDLSKMVYLECVIKECSRLYPAAPVVFRQVHEEFPLGRHILPKDCSIVVLIAAIHRNKDYYQNPIKFIPERFLQNEFNNNLYWRERHPYAYIPFSAGPRNCVGQKYAMYQMKTVISTILRKFTLIQNSKFQTIKDIDKHMKMDITFRIENGIVGFKERKISKKLT